MNVARLLLPALILSSLAPLALAKEAPGDTADAPATEAVALDEIRRFVSVFRTVRDAYVDPVDDATLMSAAIRGLLADLDPHSGYLDHEETSSLNEQASGEYGGLGLEVVMRPDGALQVIAPIDDTPAARGGIRPGDVIVQINDTPIQGAPQRDAVERLRGEPGSTVRLTVEREGSEAPIELQLTREVIRVASVRVEALEPGYWYVRVAQFQADSGGELRRRFAAARKQAGNAPVRGVVLDLRSNPGGLLGAGVEVADAFLDRGNIVSTRGRLPQSNYSVDATPGDIADGAPMVLLMDDGTASASEVVAGALRDHRRAVLMGSTSFGKGSVQTVLPLDNGDSIKLTTARYYSPNGQAIQATGLVPDIVLRDDVELQARGGNRPASVREADLPGHLAAEADEPAPRAAADARAPRDYAVQEAMNLLKGLDVFRSRVGDAPSAP